MRKILGALGAVTAVLIGVVYALFATGVFGPSITSSNLAGALGGLAGALLSAVIVVSLIRWREGSWPWEDV